MKIELSEAGIADAPAIHRMQVEAFTSLYEKYQDDETSPAKDTVDKILVRMGQMETTYFKILADDILVGAVRIFQFCEERCRVSPIFILPHYQNIGIAQRVFEIIENIYSKASIWCLDTILQEAGNCYLYEKIGYVRTGEEEIINENMTIVSFEKRILKLYSK